MKGNLIMKTEVRVPMFAEGVKRIKIRQWYVNVGDKVSVGDKLCEAATDKITIFIEAPVNGYVSALHAEERDYVEVDEVVADLTDTPEEK